MKLAVEFQLEFQQLWRTLHAEPYVDRTAVKASQRRCL
ncbi:hypothetical protein DB31_8557 [Hyalangium minutum]|uniref:Uncharacterized protein n=1 Tax=Hyalangium minutum TaxID=394096 RepID=A0A085WHP1_9BACT|nr:hypothetical protein DB31_8557 [Hyalangium minutum]